MPIHVSGIVTGMDGSEEQAVRLAVKRLGVSPDRVRAAYVVKQSLDARRQDRPRLVRTVGIELVSHESEAAAAASDPCVSYRETFALSIRPGTEKPQGRIAVAGFGPAGMFAALLLAKNGYRPLVLERGAPVERRVQAVDRFWKTGMLNPDCNVQFGEGGAGTFSDGKLTTRISDPYCEYVLKALAEHGAPGEILKKAKPHIGTDKLRGVVRSIREEILSLGGEILFDTPMEELVIQNGTLTAVRTPKGEIPVCALILAVGHSARDTFAMLRQKGVPMEVKPFSVGARIEQRQAVIDQGLYGKLAGDPRLPKGEYQLSYREGDRCVYTFCMCPGGLVVPAASEQGGVVVNGMSEFARDGENANAALVVSVGPQDFGNDPMEAVAFQRRLEQAAFTAGGGGYRAPAATVGRFLEGAPGLCLGKVQPSYALGVMDADLRTILPPAVTGMMEKGLRRFQRKLPGFGAPDGVLTGVETRTSSPIRVLRQQQTRMSQGVENLYPCGEGAGYAGGIMSAAVDGLHTAHTIIERFAPAGG